MKELIEFLQSEFTDTAYELQDDLQHLYDVLDKMHSEIDTALPTIKGDYAKIGKYYSMGQELNKTKAHVKEICDLFSDSEDIDESEETTNEKLSEAIPEQLPEPQTEVPKSIEDTSEDEIKEENGILEKNGKIDYTLYRVDDSVPHTLSENFTYKRPYAFSFERANYLVKDWKQLLLMFCEIMYNRNHTLFKGIVLNDDMQGKSRVYFSDNKLIYKNMVDGREIGKGIFVETNQNANGVCSIIKAILNKYNLPSTLFLIYLKADYTPLHQIEIKNEEKSNNLNISITKKIDSKASMKSDPDDYRFAKDPHVQISDPAMDGLSQRMGTPSHLEYLHMKEDDTRRHKSRCAEYDNKKSICLCTSSANYLLKCGGSSHCKYYREESEEDSTEQNQEDITQLEEPLVVRKKQVIKVLPKDDVKKSPICKNTTKQSAISVYYYYDNKRKNNLLAGYYCEKCKETYISDVLYKMYTANKKEKNIDVVFVKA